MEDTELIENARAVLRWRQLSEECSAADVSAALLTATGNVYRGVSISAACGIGFCGETAAIAQMVTAGETHILKLVALSGDGRLMPPVDVVENCFTRSTAPTWTPKSCWKGEGAPV